MAKNSDVAGKKVSESSDQPDKKGAAKAKQPKAASSQIEKALASKAKKSKKADKAKSPKTKSAAEPKAVKTKLVWEALPSQFKAGKQADDGFRTKVPGGWFVSVSRNKGGGAFFYPDPAHQWDGSSL